MKKFIEITRKEFIENESTIWKYEDIEELLSSSLRYCIYKTLNDDKQADVKLYIDEDREHGLRCLKIYIIE